MVKMATVWDRTAEFLSDNIGAIVPIALLAFFVPTSIEGNFEAAMTDASPSLVLTLRLVQLGFAILSLWGSLAITALALEIGGSDTAGRIAGRRLLPALLIAIVCLAVALTAVLPIPLVLGASGVDLAAVAEGRNVEFGTGVAGFVALYGLVLVALMLWLAARLIVIWPVVVREGRGLSALRQSWKLTRGTAWRVVGVIVLFSLLSWVAMLAANTVFGSIFALVAGGGEGGVSLAGLLTAIVVAAVQTGFSVIVPVFTAKLYQALTAEAGLREGVILA